MLILPLPASEAQRGLGPLSDSGQPCLRNVYPEERLGVPGEVGTLKRGQGFPGRHPPGLAQSSPPGSAVLGTGHGLAREVGASHLPSLFFLCQVYFVSPRAAAGQDSGHSPMGPRRGGERGPTAVLVPQPERITNDASSQKSRAGGAAGDVSGGERQPDVLQQLQGCCPELMLPEHSPTVMPHRPPQSGLPYSECASRGGIARLPVLQCTLVLLVFLPYPSGTHAAWPGLW